MTELLEFAAQLARGDMHPSHCVEDYRKGTGRAEFAAMASDYADRCRGKVRILKEAAERIAELERELEEARADGKERLEMLDRACSAIDAFGYRSDEYGGTDDLVSCIKKLGKRVDAAERRGQPSARPGGE